MARDLCVRLLWCGLLVGLLALPACAGLRQPWAVDDGEKIFQDDLFHPLKARNTVWDGATVRLYGARNEVLAFQLILEADGVGAAQVDVRAR